MLDGSLEVTVGGSGGVTFRFTVSNVTDEPVELTFRDAGQVDFAVRTADGEAVWRWSEGRAFAQSTRTARLEPGESAVFEEVWPDPRPGDYTAEATLRVVEDGVRAETPFSV